jgi:beta-fructofuranosidase
VYSTFTERFVTHYRVGESPCGPWRAPPNDTFDGRAYYAAKTAGDGRRRFSFGWNPTRKGETDSGDWQWGGSLVVHEILRDEDGNLGVRLPPEIGSAFNAIPGDPPNPRMGSWSREGNGLVAHSVEGFSWCEMGTLPETCRISTSIQVGEGTRGCGLVLRCDEDLGGYYQVRLEPANRRFVFDRWPRPGDQPFMLERPLAMDPGGRVDLEVILDGSIVEIYTGNRVAMSTRAYDSGEGNLGLFVSEGSAVFEGTEISVL